MLAKINGEKGQITNESNGLPFNKKNGFSLPQADLAALQEQLTDVQNKLNAIEALLLQNTQTENKIGDWVPASVAMKLTGLKRSSLLALRKTGKLTSSTISGKCVFYRRSDFEKLLNENELK
jgi:hypothetical protein